jgi:hypothetical protein
MEGGASKFELKTCSACMFSLSNTTIWTSFAGPTEKQDIVEEGA